MQRFLITLMRLFGMGAIKTDGTMCGKTSIAYNCLIIFLHVAIAVYIAIDGSLEVNYNQNTLTKSSFWIQYYGKILLNIIIIISIINYRQMICGIHCDLRDLESKCLKFGKPIVISKRFTIFTLVMIFVTAPIMLIVDVVKNNSDVNVFIILSAYIPGISIMIYITYMSYLKSYTSGIFKSLNSYLNDFANNLSWAEKLDGRLASRKKKDAGIGTEKLHAFFAVHENIYYLTNKLNKLYSFEYLMYMLLGLHGIILIIYLVILDLVRLRTKQGICHRVHFFTEYWSLMYVQGIFAIILAAHELNEAGNESGAILHHVRSIHPDLNEHASVYSFQLMYTTVNINAAGFFDLDYSTLMGVLGITIKYVFILMQFDVGVDVYIT